MFQCGKEMVKDHLYLGLRHEIGHVAVKVRGFSMLSLGRPNLCRTGLET